MGAQRGRPAARTRLIGRLGLPSVSMRTAKLFQRVVIKGGMAAFVGKTGRVVNIERDGSTKMYRVRLDVPVEIAGIGKVTDDLWTAEFLGSTK